MSEGKKETKWAAEVYDFIRILRRTGRSIYGLVMLLLGWTLFLILVQNISHVPAGAPPVLTVPWFRAGAIVFVSIKVADLLIPGALAILIGWAVAGGLAVYLGWPVRRLLARAQGRLYVGLAPFQSFTYDEDVNAARLPAQVFSSATQRWVWRWGRQPIAQKTRFIVLPQYRVPTNKSSASLMRRILALDVMLWGSFLADATTLLWLNVERPPLQLDDEDGEDGRVRADLFPANVSLADTSILLDRDNPVEAYVAFCLAVLHAIDARLSTEDAKRKKWLRRLSERRRKEQEKRQKQQERQGPTQQQQPGGEQDAKDQPSTSGKSAATVRDNDKHLESLGVLYLRLRHVLVQRRAANLFSWLTRYLETLAGDVVRLEACEQARQSQALPRPCPLLASLVGQWVGSRIYRWDLEEPGADEVAYMVGVVTKCLDMDAYNAANWYRLGALLCLQREGSRAVEVLIRAMDLDAVTFRNQREAINFAVRPGIELLGGTPRAAKLATFTALGARALCSRDPWVRKTALDGIAEHRSELERLSEYNDDTGRSATTTLAVLDELRQQTTSPRPAITTR